MISTDAESNINEAMRLLGNVPEPTNSAHEARLEALVHAVISVSWQLDYLRGYLMERDGN